MVHSEQERSLALRRLEDLQKQQREQLGPALVWLSRARQQGLAVLPALLVFGTEMQAESIAQVLRAQNSRLQAQMLLRVFAREDLLAEKTVLGLHKALDFVAACQDQYGEQIDGLLIERSRTVALSGQMYLRSPRGLSERVLQLRCWPGAQLEQTGQAEARHVSRVHVDLNAGEADLQPPPFALSIPLWRRLLQQWDRAQRLFGEDIILSWQILDGQVWLRGLWPHARRQQLRRLGAQVSGDELWSSFVLREDLAYSLTPLSLDIWQHRLLPVVFETLTGLPDSATRERRMLPVDLVSGRFFWSINRLLATPSGRLLLRLAARLDPAAWPNLRGAMQHMDLQAAPLAGLRKLWTTTKSLRALLRLSAEALRALRARRSVQSWKNIGRDILKRSHQDLSGLEDAELLAAIESETLVARDLLRRGLAHELLAAGLIHLGQHFWPRTEAQSFERLEHNLPATPSADLLRRCRSLVGVKADHLQADPRWISLIEEHGHRSVRELDLAAARWTEDSRFLRQCIHAANPDQTAAPTELIARSESRFSPQHWLGRIWSAVQLREWPRWAFSAQLFMLRKHYLELSRRLLKRNILPREQDIWFAEHELLKDLLLGQRHDQEAIAAQKLQPAAQLWAEQRYNTVPLVLSADGCEWTAEQSAGAKAEPHAEPHAEPNAILPGAAASAGRIRGRARVILQPNCSEIQAGEILVTPTLTAAMAPLLATSKALVTELGDLASVAALMARSQRMPAVTGVLMATKNIANGALIEVDGDRGAVRILADS